MVDLCKCWIFHVETVCGNAMKCRVVQYDLYNINNTNVTNVNNKTLGNELIIPLNNSKMSERQTFLVTVSLPSVPQSLSQSYHVSSVGGHFCVAQAGLFSYFTHESDYYWCLSGQYCHISVRGSMIRHHSFPRNAEFWAEPRNLPISAEFLCFHRILRNSLLGGDKGTNTTYFDGVLATVLYVYMISPWNTWLPLRLWQEEYWRYWAELIWNIAS